MKQEKIYLKLKLKFIIPLFEILGIETGNILNLIYEDDMIINFTYLYYIQRQFNASNGADSEVSVKLYKSCTQFKLDRKKSSVCFIEPCIRTY